MHEGTEPWNLAHVYLIVNQAPSVQCIYNTASTSLRSRHMEYDCSVQTTSWCLRPVVHAIYAAHPIHGTCHQSGSPLQNRSTAGHFPRKAATSKAVWPYCLSRTGSRPRTRTASFHQSSFRGLASPKRSSTPVWLRTVEADLQPLNFGLHTACRHAAKRSAWWSPVRVGPKQSCSLTDVSLHDDNDDDFQAQFSNTVAQMCHLPCHFSLRIIN